VTLNHRVHAVEDSPRAIQGDCIRREAWEGCINGLVLTNPHPALKG